MKQDDRNRQPLDQDRKPFEEPRLTYVPPKLRERGKVEDVTQQSDQGGFFGSFSP